MVFYHALALNMPFGFCEQHIKLNRLCAQFSYEILVESFISRVSYDQLVDHDHETPPWLEDASRSDQPHPVAGGMTLRDTPYGKRSLLLKLRRIRLPVIIGVLLLVLWNAVIVFLSWGLTRHSKRQEGVRWWSVYVPIDVDISGYISLGIFIMLGFWVNDAYARYWRAIQLWEVEIRPNISQFAFQLSMVCPRGMWHHRDLERLLAHLAALPYAIMMHLRGIRDVSCFDGILSAKDIAAVADAPELPGHIMHVILAYINHADAKHLSANADMMTTFGSALLMINANITQLEDALLECDAIRKFPISPSFTTHLQIYTAFWLLLLPFTLILFNGFLSFIYVIVIGYSVINLIYVGHELADPFGLDSDDLPLATFCDEVKASVRDIYIQTGHGLNYFVQEVDYDRSALTAQRPEEDVADLELDDHEMSIRGTIRTVLRTLPSVPVLAQVIAILWSVAAVFISWGFSNFWERDIKDDCPHWCSPIDVQSPVLGDVGFSLFMILAFRASDAIHRYNQGARTMCDLEMNLRNVAVEIVQAFPDGTFHPNDKERIVAHLAQIPLQFRDTIQGITRKGDDDREGLLMPEDRRSFENSPAPLEHLLRTVESYFISPNGQKEPEMENLHDSVVTYSVTRFVMKRMRTIRALMTQALCVKRFAIIKSYHQHQHVFAVMWLALLPFSMAPKNGFWAILWSSIISYAVLSMENLATTLADPYGQDSIDLPIAKLCLNASAAVLSAVDSVQWDCDYHVRHSEIDLNNRLGTVVKGQNVYCKHLVASSAFHDMHNDNEEKLPPIVFKGPRGRKTKATFLAHIVRSVPWVWLLAVTAWTVLACILSFIARDKEPEEKSRWWTSLISVSGNVTTHLSVAAFALLSFYVREAFARYNVGGNVWYDYLRAYCHSLLSQLMSYWAKGELHEEDHRRMVGHLSAIPLLLKKELRYSRDVREIKALVSSSDLARIECADSMAVHCLDVVRAYFYKIMTREKAVGIDKSSSGDSTESIKRNPGRLSLIMWNDLVSIENGIQDALHLNRYRIAPGFTNLLKTLLGLWFLVLPLVLAELSGWFTILWVPIISYGLLGMLSIAAELQNPYGGDLNDFDLDKEADHIATDILDTYRRQPKGFDTLIQTRDPVPIWCKRESDSGEDQDDLFEEEDNPSWLDSFREGFRLAMRPVSFWVLAGAGLWAALIVYIALLISQYFPQDGANDSCKPWFCSAIAVDKEVKEYVGFALFMLLGFRLTDSHFRYTHALQAWQENILGMTRLVSSRWFGSYKAGNWHEGDLQRIAGHLSGYAVALMGGLRDRDYREKLEGILDKSDVDCILATCERDDYCIDVLRAYLISAEEKKMKGKEHSAGGNELIRLMDYVQQLGSTATPCVVMGRVPMAHGYIQHLRIFMFIWLMMLPLALVESAGWISILWVVIIAYGVIGIERWSNELGDPFGFDPSDAPMERLCDRIIDAVRNDLFLYSQGLGHLIVQDRQPFPAVESESKYSDSDTESV